MVNAAAAAAFTGASLQSATGFGFALVLSPVLFALLDPAQAVSALLALGVVLNVLVLLDGGRVRWRALAPLLVAALPGLGVGLVLLSALSKGTLQVAVGCGVIAAAVAVWRAESSPEPQRAERRGLPTACAAGLTTGALTTSLSLSGPPLVLWLRTQRLDPGELRASLAAAFLALNLTGGALVLAAEGGARAVDPGLLAGLAVVVVAGHLAGARAFRRLDPRRFAQAGLALILAAGLASVAAGL
jgi:uncharacterized membrane protein YfcA